MSRKIEVGARVRAEWLEVDEKACLSGTQIKLGATSRVVVGKVQAFAVSADVDPASYGPSNPPPREHVWARVLPDGGGDPVDVKVNHIREVLPPEEG